VLSTILVDGRVCWPHLCTQTVYYTSVDRNTLTPVLRFVVILLYNMLVQLFSSWQDFDWNSASWAPSAVIIIIINRQFLTRRNMETITMARRLLQKLLVLPMRQWPLRCERKCADTIGTVLILWAGHFQYWNINIFFQIKYTQAMLSNSTRKLLWFEITKMLIAV